MNKDTVLILIWIALIGGVFAWMWWKGHLVRLSQYVQQTKEELRKCTWPTWDELKGHTVVVTLSMIILGGFTVGVDFLFNIVISRLI